MAEDNQSMKILFMGFVAILIGIVLIDVLGDEENIATQLATQINETVTLSSGTTSVADVTGKLYTVSFFGNATVNSLTDSANITIGTDVNISAKGVLTTAQNKYIGGVGNLTNKTIFADGDYNVTYSFGRAGYVQDSKSRVFINLVPLFFAIAILAISVIFVMAMLRKQNMID